jgi:alcohol dehydrogenase class IV
MQKFEFTSPAQQIIFGAGSLDRLNEFVTQFRWERLLLCASASSHRNGNIARIKKILKAHLVAVYDQVQSHVPDVQVSQVRTLAHENKIDAVIGLGGGSPIGMAATSAGQSRSATYGSGNRHSNHVRRFGNDSSVRHHASRG